MIEDIAMDNKKLEKEVDCMKLELRYDNPSPTYYGDGVEPEWYFDEGQFDSYQELLAFTEKHWNWRAFWHLYISFADECCPTKDEEKALETMNETFKRDLAKIEIKERGLENVKNKSLVCRMKAIQDQPDGVCGTYENYYKLMNDVSENYAYQVYSRLYITFPDEYVPDANDMINLENLNAEFEKDKEQAIKF